MKSHHILTNTFHNSPSYLFSYDGRVLTHEWNDVIRPGLVSTDALPLQPIFLNMNVIDIKLSHSQLCFNFYFRSILTLTSRCFFYSQITKICKRNNTISPLNMRLCNLQQNPKSHRQELKSPTWMGCGGQDWTSRPPLAVTLSVFRRKIKCEIPARI